MNSFKQYLKSQGKSQSSAEKMNYTLCSFLNYLQDERMNADTVNYNDLLGYVSHCRKNGNQQRTIRQYVNVIRHFFDYRIKLGYREDNPARFVEIKGVRRKKLYAILTHEELQKIFTDYPTEKLAEKRDRIMLGLLINQGVSVEELQKLTVKDLKLREGTIYIAGGRKSNERVLELKSHQVLDIMEYSLKTRLEILKRSKRESDKLFVTTGKSDSLKGAIDKFRQKLKTVVPHLENLHQIRASIITHWLKRYDLREVQYMAGHRYVSSTEQYMANNLEDLQADIDKFHPIG